MQTTLTQFSIGDRVTFHGRAAEIYLALPFAADMDYLLKFTGGTFQCVSADAIGLGVDKS